MLVVEAVRVFAILFRIEGVVARGYAAFVDLVTSRGCLDLCIANQLCGLEVMIETQLTHPEVDFKVSTASKLPVVLYLCQWISNHAAPLRIPFATATCI